MLKHAQPLTPWGAVLRAWVALLTICAVLTLFGTAVTHHHDTDLQDRDCPICTAVVHQGADLNPALPMPLALIVLLYVLPLARTPVASFASPKFTPPICGPPKRRV